MRAVDLIRAAAAAAAVTPASSSLIRILSADGRCERTTACGTVENKKLCYRRGTARRVMSNFIYHQAIERENKQETVYNKHQNTTGTLDYQAVTHV